MRSPQDSEDWGVCITGEAGSGKSAIFGALHREQSGALVLAHAAGASQRAPSVDAMLRRWIDELAAELGAGDPLPAGAGPEAVEAAFASLLWQVAEQRRVVVLIDALDQFEATPRGRFATWLPRMWHPNARLIATAIPGEASQALTRRAGVGEIALAPLEAGEARDIVSGICRRYHRGFEPEVIEALLAKTGERHFAFANPLWLVLAVEELNLLDEDDFTRAQRSYTGLPAQRLRALMLDLIADLPADIPGLYRTTFDRAAALFGAGYSAAFLGLIAVGRGGWRESDFRAAAHDLDRRTVGRTALRLVAPRVPRPDASARRARPVGFQPWADAHRGAPAPGRPGSAGSRCCMARSPIICWRSRRTIRCGRPRR